jgi:hypothetical protein
MSEPKRRETSAYEDRRLFHLGVSEPRIIVCQSAIDFSAPTNAPSRGVYFEGKRECLRHGLRQIERTWIHFPVDAFEVKHVGMLRCPHASDTECGVFEAGAANVAQFIPKQFLSTLETAVNLSSPLSVHCELLLELLSSSLNRWTKHSNKYAKAAEEHSENHPKHMVLIGTSTTRNAGGERAQIRVLPSNAAQSASRLSGQSR